MLPKLVALGALLNVTLAVLASASSVRFARTYGDDMVLQHGGSGASIWGYAPPGENVSVAVKSTLNGVLLGNVSSEAADDGTWQAVLPPQPPGNNKHSITAVASSGDEATLARVMFGDVWVCSGQSNSEIHSASPFLLLFFFLFCILY
jgi:sialate O-acetylesterase